MPTAKPSRRRRPAWHRRLGLAVVTAAILVIVLNDLVLLGLRTPMPGGHSELYLVTGVGVMAVGAWLMGLFDPV